MKYIAYLTNGHGDMITFERWTCSNLETVTSNMKKLLNNSLYRACNRGAIACKVYRTPDGYNREEKPCKIFFIKAA